MPSPEEKMLNPYSSDPSPAGCAQPTGRWLHLYSNARFTQQRDYESSCVVNIARSAFFTKRLTLPQDNEPKMDFS
jgi:hypothetical protein